MDSFPDDLLQQCVWRLPTPDQAVARCVCRRFRDLFSAPISFAVRARLHRLEPWLCVIGGVQEEKGELVAEMFDFRARRWRPMPAHPPTSNFNISCAVIGYNLCVVGGFVGLADYASKMPVYNLQTSTWKEASQMQFSREACGCGVIRNRIYVAGGFCRLRLHGKRLRSGEVYIPDKDLWCPIASMKERRSCCASAVVEDKLYIIGGYGTESVLQSVEVYDPAEDSWVQRASMPRIWFLAGCASIGSKIYVIGSDMNAMDAQELAVFDTKLDSWSFVGSIPFNELVMGSKCSLWGCSVTSIADKLYVLGGASSVDGGGLNSALVYDSVTEQWATMRQMHSSRHACGAVGIYC
ncbi:hypothetical protein L7F22_056964 [Adiantum nelumboides]|nr:hypothetical protein [Adiantum nelumboides]